MANDEHTTVQSSTLQSAQRREWDSASTGWKKWWQQIEQALRPASDRMMDLAEIRTGKRFAAQHIHIVRLANGKVAEHWAIRNDVGMLQQLGAIPTPSQGS